MTRPLFKESARLEYKKPRALLLLLASTGLLFVGFHIIYYAMFLVENRPGALLFDPVHYLLPAPMNFSNLVFMATYSAVFVIAVDSLIDGPIQLSKVFLGYSLILFLRSLSMVLVPLDPPDGLIPLVDPLIAFFNPEPFVATRDLFFSGHCATLYFFYHQAKNQMVKYFLAFLNVFVIVALSLQRVHYTIDIIGGLIVAFGVSILMEKIFTRYFRPLVQKQVISSLSISKKDAQTPIE